MLQTTDIARAILRALTDAHIVGRPPCAIVLDVATKESFQEVGLGYWSAGPGTWSVFNVPVVIERVPGWRLRFSSETNASPRTLTIPSPIQRPNTAQYST